MSSGIRVSLMYHAMPHPARPVVRKHPRTINRPHLMGQRGFAKSHSLCRMRTYTYMCKRPCKHRCDATKHALTCYPHVSSLISRGANLSQKCCIISSNDSFIPKRLTTSTDKLSTGALVLRCSTQVKGRITASCACGSN